MRSVARAAGFRYDDTSEGRGEREETLTVSARSTSPGPPARGPARVLVVSDQPVLAKVVGLALNHGRFHTQVVPTVPEALAVLGTWRPHLAIIDMDIAHGQVLDRLGGTVAGTERVPVVALTRRGDLRTKLAAFEQGVDDILTVPFSTDELLARVLVIMRRSYGAAVGFTQTIRVGELEI